MLQQQWYDPRLRYSNRSQYEFLNAIHHYDDIWLPDTYFIMHGDFKDPLIPVHFALRIYRNGTVNYLMRYVLISMYSQSARSHRIASMLLLRRYFHLRKPCLRRIDETLHRGSRNLDAYPRHDTSFLQKLLVKLGHILKTFNLR